uniref:Uncharacterized protein n=1 Tax=Gossypium raimondii TaxID=29730 RepID=A0A0D2T5Z7_GOSRA|nr:hypothetical protein B456_008G144300 [Gossypium raimondii]
MRAPPQTDPSFCSSAYEVLAVVSNYCSTPKGRFLRVTHPSDLHMLSMSPTFILSQDQTLHEIHSCITYSFLVRRQSQFEIVLYPCTSYSPRVHSQKYSHSYPLTQSHEPLIHSYSITAGDKAK